MKKEIAICDICKTEHKGDYGNRLVLTIPPNIFTTNMFGNLIDYKFNDICGVCSKSLAVFVRDNLIIDEKNQKG